MAVLPYKWVIFGGVGGKIFVVFVVETLSTNILHTNEEYLYLQCTNEMITLKPQNLVN